MIGGHPTRTAMPDALPTTTFAQAKERLIGSLKDLPRKGPKRAADLPTTPARKPQGKSLRARV
jgi:hypothetical protein